MNKSPPCHRYEEPEGDQECPLCRELNCKQEELARRIGAPPPARKSYIRLSMFVVIPVYKRFNLELLRLWVYQSNALPKLSFHLPGWQVSMQWLQSLD